MSEAEREGGDDLPQGVLPLPRTTKDPGAGCRVTGCLYGVSLLFALALIALVIGLMVRMWITPSMPRM
jgi:hypothetical protein